MSAYVISEVEMRDAAGFETYRSIAAVTISKYGGRYLIRGGAVSLGRRRPAPEDDHRRRISDHGPLA